MLSSTGIQKMLLSGEKAVPKLSKDDKTKIAKWLYGKGKEWIDRSDLRNLDRTAKIFIELLVELNSNLADKLYKYYDG